jgi:hypothetical protein
MGVKQNTTEMANNRLLGDDNFAQKVHAAKV